MESATVSATLLPGGMRAALVATRPWSLVTQAFLFDEHPGCRTGAQCDRARAAARYLLVAPVTVGEWVGGAAAVIQHDARIAVECAGTRSTIDEAQ